MTTTSSAESSFLQIVAASSYSAICRYFAPLVRLATVVTATLRRLSPTLATRVSRIQRIEWMEDVQLQELIELRRVIVDYQSQANDSVTHADAEKLRREIKGLSASVERLTSTFDTIQTPSGDVDYTRSSDVRRIFQLISRIDHAWVKEIAELIVDQTVLIVECMARPAAIYRGEAELYRILTELVEKLVADDTLFGICGEKSWQTDPVKQYLLANERAAARGVRITRIFHETSDRAAIDAANHQALGGISVRLLRKRHLDQLTSRQRLPAGLGIAIVNSETVLIHSGVGPTAFAYRFDNAQFAAVVRTQFEIVERLADPVGPNFGSGGAAFRRFPVRQ